jgi:hypothetical protein
VFSWMRSWFSMENLASMGINNCVSCQRLYDPALRPPVRPICQVDTYQGQQIIAHYYASEPVESDIPDYVPQNCGVRLEK